MVHMLASHNQSWHAVIIMLCLKICMMVTTNDDMMYILSIHDPLGPMVKVYLLTGLLFLGRSPRYYQGRSLLLLVLGITLFYNFTKLNLQWNGLLLHFQHCSQSLQSWQHQWVFDVCSFPSLLCHFEELFCGETWIDLLQVAKSI